MNLVIQLLDASMGGHTRTAVSTARALQKMGHGVTFVIGQAAKSEVIDGAGFPVLRVEFGVRNAIPATLARLHREGKCDAIHTFTTLGLADACIFAARHGLNVVYTRCGGPKFLDPFDQRTLSTLNLPFVSCVSEENVELFTDLLGMPRDRVIVLPGRVDADFVAEKQNPSKQAALRAKYGIEENVPILFRICRVGPAYEESVVQGMMATDELRKRGVAASFVHIGHVDVQESFDRLCAIRDDVNARHGTGVVTTAQDEAADALPYNGMATVTIGAGRSAMEALALGKPTMVIGNYGYAGLTSPEESGPIAYYNFAGRNVKEPKPQEESVRQVADVVQRLLQDSAYYAAMSDYAREFCVTNYDVATAARRYLSLYERGHEEFGRVPLANARRAERTSRVKRVLRALIPRERRLAITNLGQYGKK